MTDHLRTSTTGRGSVALLPDRDSALRDALRKFYRHKWRWFQHYVGCEKYYDISTRMACDENGCLKFVPHKCTCGLDEIMNAILSVPGGGVG